MLLKTEYIYIYSLLYKNTFLFKINIYCICKIKPPLQYRPLTLGIEFESGFKFHPDLAFITKKYNVSIRGRVARAISTFHQIY